MPSIPPESTATTAPNGRCVPLDFLRGIAVLLVLGYHCVIPTWHAGVFWFPSRVLVRVGWTGVDLFFVLSGFLVGGLLLNELKREGKLHAARFLIRRSLKIWPSYYFFLAAGSLLIVLHPFGGPQRSLQEIWPNLLHVQNYWPTPFGITWSLAVEEHFYLALPLALVGLARLERDPKRRLQFLPYFVLAVLLVCLTLRFWGGIGARHNSLKQFFPTHLRIDSLMFGVLLAYCFHYHGALWDRLASRWRLWLPIGLLLLFPAFFIRQSNKLSWTLGFTLYYLGFGAILMAFVGPQSASAKPWPIWKSKAIRPITTIGFYSYTIYLWHNDFVKHGLIWLFKRPLLMTWPDSLRWPVASAVYVFLAVATGIVMSKLVEGPFLRLRERLFPAYTSSLVDPVANESLVS